MVVGFRWQMPPSAQSGRGKPQRTQLHPCVLAFLDTRGEHVLASDIVRVLAEAAHKVIPGSSHCQAAGALWDLCCLHLGEGARIAGSPPCREDLPPAESVFLPASDPNAHSPSRLRAKGWFKLSV